MNRPISEAVKESSFIVRGRPGDSYSDWDKQHQRIFTYTHFTVTDVLRGDLKANKILVRQPGGGVGGVEMNVPGTAHFNNEEDLVLLLGAHNDEDDSYDVPGFTTGKYNVFPGENGEPVLVNSMGGSALYDPRKDAKTLSYNSRIPLEIFRRIAAGEDVPEASHPQFQGSGKVAPKGAFEADHHAFVLEKKDAQKNASAEVKVETSTQASSEFWVPLSFALIAVFGIVVLWLGFKKEG